MGCCITGRVDTDPSYGAHPEDAVSCGPPIKKALIIIATLAAIFGTLVLKYDLFNVAKSSLAYGFTIVGTTLAWSPLFITMIKKISECQCFKKATVVIVQPQPESGKTFVLPNLKIRADDKDSNNSNCVIELGEKNHTFPNYFGDLREVIRGVYNNIAISKITFIFKGKIVGENDLDPILPYKDSVSIHIKYS